MQVSRPLSLPPSARDNLYHGLPITVKSALRSRLQSFNTEEEVCVLNSPAMVKWLVLFESSMHMKSLELMGDARFSHVLCQFH
jgi:hypothetical protein